MADRKLILKKLWTEGRVTELIQFYENNPILYKGNPPNKIKLRSDRMEILKQQLDNIFSPEEIVDTNSSN